MDRVLMQIHHSDWFVWERRGELPDWFVWERRGELPDCAGLYVIAKGDVGNVAYIGRTWSAKGIRHRVQAFNRSAITGNGGHAGGVTFHKTFGADVTDLHVRCHVPSAVNPDPSILRPYIEYAERRLIWEHVERAGALPNCNSE